MTGRKTLDQMNSNDLDQLHDQLARAEAAIERVRNLADRWDNALAPDRPYARALRAVLDEPAPTSGAATTQTAQQRIADWANSAIAFPPSPAAAEATVPCPACRRADQAGLAPAEQHPACAKEQH